MSSEKGRGSGFQRPVIFLSTTPENQNRLKSLPLAASAAFYNNQERIKIF
jgi:hypothetical protein